MFGFRGKPPIDQCNVLTNLQFTLKFICRFIIRESAFCGNEVENSVVVTVVADVTANQLCIPYNPSYVWPALKKKIPLVFNLVHLFLFALRGEGDQSPPILYLTNN